MTKQKTARNLPQKRRTVSSTCHFTSLSLVYTVQAARHRVSPASELLCRYSWSAEGKDGVTNRRKDAVDSVARGSCQSLPPVPSRPGCGIFKSRDKTGGKRSYNVSSMDTPTPGTPPPPHGLPSDPSRCRLLGPTALVVQALSTCRHARLDGPR